jgi:hypothetical protein
MDEGFADLTRINGDMLGNFDHDIQKAHDPD